MELSKEFEDGFLKIFFEEEDEEESFENLF